MSVRGEERSRKRCAVRDDESVTFFGEEEQDKRADVARRSAGRSKAVFATTSYAFSSSSAIMRPMCTPMTDAIMSPRVQPDESPRQ